jgi:hypothetical protein
MNATVQCPACRAPLLDGVFNRLDFAPCPSCGVPLQIEIFPAMFQKISAGQSGEALMSESESSCFYHPQKKAALPCDGCGRFLCALCDCQVDDRHYCPTCLQSGKTKGKIQSLDNSRPLYDSIALALAIYPMLIFYFTVITAPMTLFVAIRYWKAPMSILRRSKIRFIAAIVIALLQIAGWATLIIAIATRH